MFHAINLAKLQKLAETFQTKTDALFARLRARHGDDADQLRAVVTRIIKREGSASGILPLVQSVAGFARLAATQQQLAAAAPIAIPSGRRVKGGA